MKRRRTNGNGPVPAIVKRAYGQGARVGWGSAFAGSQYPRGYRYAIPRVPAPVRKELKVVDTVAFQSVCDTTGAVTLLNGVANGTDFTDRIGRKVSFVSIQIRGRIVPADVGTVQTMWRVMLVYDMQPNGALPAVLDVLREATGSSMMNLNNRDRFRVLMDKQGVLGAVNEVATTSWASSPGACNINMWRRIQCETIYDGTDALIASVQSGSVFMLTIGSNAAGNGGVFIGSVRLRFADA